MLTYNRPQHISRAVESIVAQTLTDWELLVVQDGKEQFTVDVMSGWAGKDSRIRYFRRDKGGNIADATNFALDRAQGDYVAILDDDDAWAVPEKLQSQVDFLDTHPEYVGCGGGAIVVDETGRETLRYLKPETFDDIRKVALRANPVIHSTGMFRREVLRRLGNYDVSLAGFQDWDVWLKLGEQGKLYNFPRHLTYYTLWGGGGSFHAQRGNTRSALRIVWRHRRRYAGFPLALALSTAYFLYSLLPVAIRKPTYAYLSQWKKAYFGR